MKTFRFLPLLAALLLPLFAHTARAAEAVPPLERRLRLDLWGAGLKDVALAVKESTGVDIVFYLPDLPAEENTDTVHLVTGDVSLATVLETLARRFGFRFRVAGATRVELSRGYGWAGAEPALRFARLDCLSVSGCSPEAERAFFDELLKPLPLLPDGFTVRVEPYPLPGRPGAMRAAAVLPGELAGYFVKAVECLSGGGGDFPAGGGGGGFFARAREGGIDWEQFLTRPVENPRGENLRALLADIAEQTGAAIALPPPPAAAESGRLPADTFRHTLGRICETLSKDFALGRRVFLASGGVVFERGGEPDAETDARTRELFWNGLAVAGFDARAAAARAGGAEALLRRIRREIFPGLWRDPVCALLFSPVTERLAVVAPHNAVEKIAALLTEN